MFFLVLIDLVGLCHCVNRTADSVSGTVLTKLVAQPFRKALEDLDTDGDGTIDLQEMHLEGRVGGIIETFRERMAPKLGNSDLVNAPLVAQDLLQRQALTDLITGVTGVLRLHSVVLL